MHLRQLHEMAEIAGWHNSAAVTGRRNSFLPVDVSLLANERTRQQIELWLNANPTPYRYAFHFGAPDKKIAQYRTPGIITFIKPDNPAGDALTPHMILHTMAHAIAKDQYLDNKIVRVIRMRLGTMLDREFAEDDDDGDKELLQKLCMLLHMRAASMTLNGSARGFPDLNEAAIEMLGVYIRNGRIKIAPNEHCDFETDQTTLRQLRMEIEQICDMALAREVGSVTVDD